jgi:hypothetical protein
MLMFTPLNLVPGAAAAVALAAGADAASVGAAADGAGAAELGDGVAAGLQPARMTTRPIAGAMDLNRDTGFLLLTHTRPSSILNDRR